MQNKVRKNSCFYSQINLVFSCIIFTFGMAEGAMLGSAGYERVKGVLTAGDDVGKIRGALELSERLDGRKMNKEELGHLLFYAVGHSTPSVINLFLDFGACIHSATSRQRHLDDTTVCGMSLLRAEMSLRQTKIQNIQDALEVLKTVVQAGGFDHTGEEDFSDFSSINVIIVGKRRKRDRSIEQYLLKAFGEPRASLIKGYAGSFPGQK